MRRTPRTCTLLMMAAAAWPLDAFGGSIVLRSLGTPAAAYGQMSLSLAGPGDTPMGYVILDCPRPTFSGSPDWITTCSISRENLAQGFVGPPEGQRMVVSVPRVTAVGSCSVIFSEFTGQCAGSGTVTYGSGTIPEGYGCAFVVPNTLTNTDLEIGATFTPSQGNFDEATCTRNVVTTTTVPSPGSSSTTTTLPGTDPISAFMDKMAYGMVSGLQPWLKDLLRATSGDEIHRLLRIAAGEAPRGTLKATVTAPPAVRARGAGGTKVIVKGKRKIKRDGDATIGMKLTRAGAQLLEVGDPFDAVVAISFRGKAGSSTRSSTFRVE
ncbi:MAG TPA: hypothetical protein VMS22_14735 [Candidatus Eisenbacteria bacterium]|nr:hypothetical protein [Candidatus Eisenbacteria bacterium]